MKPMGVTLVGQGRGPHVRARRQRSIHSHMISLTLDKPALELIDSGAAQVDEPAVERSLIDSLVEAAVAGDVAAHDRLLAELYPLVLRYCRGRMGHRDSAKVSADDVAQEVCLAVVAALSSYTITGRSFRPFVYAIAAHKVADPFRAIGRDRTDPVAELPEGPVVQDGPEQRLLAAELGERLGRLLQLLTARQREVLILRIAVGLTAEETAEAVGSTPGAVRVTQHRALSRLRALVRRPDRAVDAPNPDSPPSAPSVARTSAQCTPVSAGKP
jgi:RNA polymerase sigma-70 factor, ECF subfamily